MMPLANLTAFNGPSAKEGKPLANLSAFKHQAPGQAEPAEDGRTWGEAAKDNGAALMGGFAQLGGNITHLADMLLFDALPDSVHKPFEEATQFWESKKSDELKAAKQSLHEANGVGGTLGVLWDNPSLVSDLLVSSLPSMIPVAGASRLAHLGKLGKVKSSTAAISTGAALEGADAGGQAYDNVMGMTPEQLIARSTLYQNLLADGLSHDEAVSKIASRARVSSFAVTLPLSVIASKFTGAGKAEADLFTGKGVSGVAKTTTGQVVEESIQEGGNQFGSNVGTSLADDDQSLTEGVTKAATIGGVLGGAQGGAISTLGAFQKGEPDQQIEEAETPQLPPPKEKRQDKASIETPDVIYAQDDNKPKALPPSDTLYVDPTVNEQITGNRNDGLTAQKPWTPSLEAEAVEAEFADVDLKTEIENLEQLVAADAAAKINVTEPAPEDSPLEVPDGLTREEAEQSAERLKALGLDGYQSWVRGRFDNDKRQAALSLAEEIDSKDPAVNIKGEVIDKEWQAFAPESGTLNIPRNEMPQIKAEHRGALANYLKAKGINGQEKTVNAKTLKPTQYEFSPAKVEQAKQYKGGDRAILVSADNHVIDGHHQWLAKHDEASDVRIIQLDRDARTLLKEVADFPSAEQAKPAQDKPLQQRGKQSSIPVNRDTIDKAVNTFRSKYAAANNTNIKVVDRQAEIPGITTKDAVRAAYQKDSDTLYLVASAFESEGKIIETLQHELIVHKGLAALPKKQREELINTIINEAPKSNSLAADWQYIQTAYADQSAEVQAEELIALIGEKPLSKSDNFLNKLMLMINKALVAAGLSKSQLSKAELRKTVYDLASSLSERSNNREPQKNSDAYLYQKAKDPYQELFDSLGDKDKSIFDRAKAELKRQFLPKGNLPEDVFQEKIIRDSEFQAAELEIASRLAYFREAIKKSYGVPYNKLSDAQKNQLSDYLAGRGGDAIPESAKVEIHKMRLEIKGLSQQYANALKRQIDRLRDQGKVEEADARQGLLDTITANFDTYVNRSYKAFDDPGWPKKVSKATVTRALNYLAKSYANDGEITNEHKLRAARTVELMLESGTAFDSMESFIAESKLGAKDLSSLIKRKEIAPEIRALLGEYKDVEMNYAKTMTKMTRLVFNDSFLEKILEHGKGTFLFTEEDRPLDATAKIAADGSRVMEPLNGFYTYPEVAKAFTDALGDQRFEGWLETIIRLNGIVKFNKTVLSPTTAMRNFWSAAFFSFANGHWDLSQSRKSFGTLKTYFTNKGKAVTYLAKMKRLGVVYDTPYAGEMMDLLKESKIEDTLLSRGPMKGLKGFIDVAQKFYQFGDDFWKIIGFENEKAMLMKHKGMTEADAEKEAAERIRNTYPTYSMTPRFIQTLRRFPLAGTFVSFPAEIMRTSYHILRYLKEDIKTGYGARKATGVLFVSAFAYAAQAITKGMMGISDEEEEGLKDLAAPWQKNSNFLYLGRDEEGKLRYLDVSFLDPYNYWKRPINAMLRDEPTKDKLLSAAKDAYTPFFGQDIAFGTIMEAVYNKKETGGRVFNPQDTAPDQLGDILNHLRKGLQPGAIANMERMSKALSGEVSPSGRRFSVQDEVYANLGFRISTLEPKTSLFFSQYQFGKNKSDARRLLSDILRDPNPVNMDRIQRMTEVSLRSWEDAHTKMLRLIAAARASGLTDKQIEAVLRDTSIAKRDIAILLKGETPTLSVSKAALRSTLKKVRVLYGKEAAATTRQRFKDLNDHLSALHAE